MFKELIKKTLQRIAHTGVTEPFNNNHSRKIILTNRITIIFFAVSIPYLLIFYMMNLPYLALSVIPFTILFLCSIILNYYKKFTLAKFNLILVGNSALLFYSNVLGPESNIHLIFIALATTPLILFENKQMYAMIFGSLLPFALYFSLEFYSYPFFPNINLPSLNIFIIQLWMDAITFIIIILSILFYFRASENAETALLKSHQALEKAYQEDKERKILLETTSRQTAFATLTRGIAHEIRNPMGMMLSSSELIMENLSDAKKMSEYSEIIKKNIMRLTQITTSMLRYGLDTKLNRVLSNINNVIEDQLILAKATLKQRNIVTHVSLSDKIPEINMDPNAISQAVLNVLLNAIEAIGKNGAIHISSYLCSFSPISQPSHQLSGIRIEITDNGQGISDDNREHIFDPFFTTKYENCGLGLSIVLKTVHAHNGSINVESKNGQGCTVAIDIPVA